MLLVGVGYPNLFATTNRKIKQMNGVQNENPLTIKTIQLIIYLQADVSEYTSYSVTLYAQVINS